MANLKLNGVQNLVCALNSSDKKLDLGLDFDWTLACLKLGLDSGLTWAHTWILAWAYVSIIGLDYSLARSLLDFGLANAREGYKLLILDRRYLEHRSFLVYLCDFESQRAPSINKDWEKIFWIVFLIKYYSLIKINI